MHTPLFIFYSLLFAALFAEQHMLEPFSCQFQRENLLPCSDVLHFLGLNALFWNLGVIWQPLSPSGFMETCHTQIYLQSPFSDMGFHTFHQHSTSFHEPVMSFAQSTCQKPTLLSWEKTHGNLFLFLSP